MAGLDPAIRYNGEAGVRGPGPSAGSFAVELVPSAAGTGGRTGGPTCDGLYYDRGGSRVAAAASPPGLEGGEAFHEDLGNHHAA
jgi:hypothetical protein